MKPQFITITGFAHYHGKKPFKIGALITCQKEPENLAALQKEQNNAIFA